MYCQHSLGIGHLARTAHLATALTKLGPVGVIVGGKVPASFKFDARMALFSITPVAMHINGSLHDPVAGRDINPIMDERKLQICKAIATFQPDTLLIEMFPFGRKKFAPEITAGIQQAQAIKRCRIYSSVRDILVTNRSDQKRFDELSFCRLNKLFDAVLVHGDSSFCSLEETFPKLGDLEIPVHYTGYISSNTAIEPTSAKKIQRKDLIVVSCGGGRVGTQLSKLALESFPLIKKFCNFDMTLLVGANAANLEYTPQEGLTVTQQVDDLAGLLRTSKASISQCGYNTATDILRSEVPAVFVPFETQEENEQLHRANKFVAINRAVLLREKELTPVALLESLSAARTCNTTTNIKLNGATNSCAIIEARL